MTLETPLDPRTAIRELSLSHGFDAVGFADADNGNAAEQLDAYLANGFHGDMGWMATTGDRRRTPRSLWPDVKSVIVMGVNYGPDEDPLFLHDHPDCGTVSVYARGRDYHDVMKKNLRLVARQVAEDWNCEVKLFVDTAPVMEKPLAQYAGIGWQGKHTNLVSRAYGSWLFLGEIFTTLEFPPDTVETDHCGTCRSCLDVCPTGAFPEPYKLDARRCISYLTIEHKGHIPAEFRVPMGNRIYGCDDCLAVCPWNKFAAPGRHEALRPHIHLSRLRLADFAALDDEAFRRVFSGSPIKRLGRDRFVRNVLIAIGNSGDGTLADSAETLLQDVSPLVRAMAVWALTRIAGQPRFRVLRERHRPGENDPDVLLEWDRDDVSA